MDDIYEFENGEYRLASVKIKAIAYDVVTDITKKRLEVKKYSMEEDKKQELVTSLSDISDKIIELTDDLEQKLEQLDDIAEQIGHFQPITAPREEKKQNPEKEKKNEKIDETPIIPQPVVTIEKEPMIDLPKKVVENPQPKIEEKTPTPIVESVEKSPATLTQPESTITPVPKPDSQEKPAPSIKEEKTSAEPVIQEIIAESEPNQEERAEEKDQQATKEETTVTPSISSPVDNSKESAIKRFQKTTKNLSKAIMVRPNQLVNLRNSRLYQEQLLIKKGFLPATKEAIEPVAKPEQEPKELPGDIERQIEDLTVKANIYYNEGEVDKAQELYDQIKALNKEYQ